MSKKAKSALITALWVLVILVGLSVMFYPIFSDWWNTREQRRAIANYVQKIEEVKPETYDDIFRRAQEYNWNLNRLTAPFGQYDLISDYDEILDISGTGIMGYIEIPAISIALPIYHGTSAEVLNIAAGHLQGSTLPIGGSNTHGVISAHRGLPSARLFTDLDQLAVGDTFTITVLNRKMAYEVEKILIVKPYEMDKLAIIPDGDYITLMTCTPYGVNSHRLLLRSHRITLEEVLNVKVVADAAKMDPMLVVPFIAAPLFFGLIISWMISGNLRRRHKRITPDNYWKLVSQQKEGEEHAQPDKA